jgi:hypothetical protein
VRSASEVSFASQEKAPPPFMPYYAIGRGMTFSSDIYTVLWLVALPFFPFFWPESPKARSRRGLAERLARACDVRDV